MTVKNYYDEPPKFNLFKAGIKVTKIANRSAAGSVFTLAEKFDTFGRGEGYALSNLTVGAVALIAETMQTYGIAGRFGNVEVGGAGASACRRLPGSGLASSTTLGVERLSDPAGNRIVTTANALRQALGNINCRFFQGSFTTGYWQVPKGLVQKYSDLLKNNNSSSIVIPVAEYSSAALTLANGFALLNQEPSLFDDLADALATYKGDRAIDSCYTVCEAITRYFRQFEAGNPLLAALNFANLMDCVSACTTECCQ